MTKATIIVDIHDVSILLSGVMMLENELNLFLETPEELRDTKMDLPSTEELKESLSLTKEKRKMLEDLLQALQFEELKEVQS